MENRPEALKQIRITESSNRISGIAPTLATRFETNSPVIAGGKLSSDPHSDSKLKAFYGYYIIQSGRIQQVNARLAESLGYSVEEMLDKNPLDFIDKRDHLTVFALENRLRREESSINHELRATHADGSVVDLQVLLGPCLFDGKPAIHGNALDIGRLKQAEGSMKKVAEEYRIIFESTGTAMMIIEDDTTISMINAEMTRLSGFTKEEVEGVRSWTEFVHSDDLKQLLDNRCTQTLEPGEGPRSFEFRFVNKDGNARDVYMTVTIIPDTDRAVASVLDITDRKQAERALLYRAQFENLVTSISTNFINQPIDLVDSGMDMALQTIGEFVGVDRGTIFCLSEDKRTLAVTHEWCAPAVVPLKETHKELPIENFPWWIEKLNQQQLILFPDQDITSEATTEKHLLLPSIESLIAVPMVIEKELVGFVALSSKQVDRGWEEEHLTLLKIIGEVFVNAIDRKRSEELLRLDESRLEALVALNQMTSGSLQQITDFALEEGVRLTGSHAGYLAFVNDEETVMTIHSWSKGALRLCEMIDKPRVFSIQTSGLFGQAVRQRKPIIINDYHALSPLKKGLPENHLPLNRYLSIPVFDGTRIVAIAGVGNKDKVYDKSDVRQLSLLMNGMWRIVQRKRAEDQLRYLSLHDPLTKMFNRTYFEEEMNRLKSGRFDPVGLIVCDVDGLKLVNDTMGHESGDALLLAAAQVIRNCFRDSDVVARVGGDEFAVIMSRTSPPAINDAYHRIRDSVEEYNSMSPRLPLSISVGYSCRLDLSMSMDDLFREADNNMYREKLSRRQTTRNAIVDTLMKAMETRDFVNEGHAERMQDLIAAFALAIGLSDPAIMELRMLAQFHDIGKVGVPDRILFKQGPLTPEEYDEVKRHSEIGHRIALSSPDLIQLADWILMHHEWANGQGYPLGLRGEEIPLECRLLSIVDAYDAMTSLRPYRKPLKWNSALEEIKKRAGIQFDQELAHK
ncbi:MAG: GAF domain-containing protein, partial [Acidobacteriota bacterium]